MNVIFVYFKNNKIKILDMDCSKDEHIQMIEEGWKHTASLNPCIFIENLFNNSKNIESDIKELSKKQ